MTKINQSSGMQAAQALNQVQDKPKAKSSGTSFTDVLSGVADVALATTAAVAPLVPGGQLVGAAAGGLYSLKQAASGNKQDLTGSNQDQIDKMWAMQKENQAYNLQYMELQNSMQADNRNFSTLSNLMKVRHDTAKSAINNMHS